MFSIPAPHSTPATRTKRGPLALAALAAAALVTGCGMVATFVPPLSVGDPLGVDGQTVTATLEEGGLAAQRTTHLDETRSFDVPDLEEDLRGFSLAGFHTQAGLTREVTLSGPVGATASDFPERFTLTRAVVEAELWDDVNGRASFARDVDLALPFERSACAADGCRYAYVGAEPLADALNVELTDREVLDTLVAILIRGDRETPNRGTFRVALEMDSEASLAGYSASFELTSDGSTIKLGG